MQSLRYIINQHSSNAPEKFAKYCDFLLKRNSKSTIDEKEAEVLTTKAINLFKYIDDKDVFQKFYSRFLAKRLIHTSSVSEDLEMLAMENLKVFTVLR
jgi:Cullin family